MLYSLYNDAANNTAMVMRHRIFDTISRTFYSNMEMNNVDYVFISATASALFTRTDVCWFEIWRSNSEQNLRRHIAFSRLYWHVQIPIVFMDTETTEVCVHICPRLRLVSKKCKKMQGLKRAGKSSLQPVVVDAK